jgi:leader peptidase (prepilin peptidase)/N-methyltransferase
LELFEAWPPALIVASLVLGLIVGSFLNVVAHRLPIMMERAWRAEAADAGDAADAVDTGDAEKGEPPQTQRFDLAFPPSRCPHCEGAIAAWHNIPVLSWLMLRGRCAHCSTAISARYPVVEAFTGIASVIVAWHFGPTLATPAALVLTWFLIALSLIDLDHKLLPDSLTLPLLWLGLLLALFSIDGAPVFADLRSSVIGAAAGYLSLWSVYQLFRLVTGKQGMGYGDFKLLAALGAWLGWQLLPLVIVLSAAVGSMVGIGLIVTGQRSRQAEIPFGPYLAGAGWLALLWGPDIMRWYSGFMG